VWLSANPLLLQGGLPRFHARGLILLDPDTGALSGKKPEACLPCLAHKVRSSSILIALASGGLLALPSQVSDFRVSYDTTSNRPLRLCQVLDALRGCRPAGWL